MTQTARDLLQTKWQDQQLPHIDGIVFADGRVILMHCATIVERGGVHTMSVSPEADTTLESVLGHQHDAWVEIEVSDQVQHDGRGLSYRCGAGAMGNEGFVACVDAGQSLVWAAFFTRSNPFWELRPIQDNVLTAVSEYELEWRYPLDAPERVRVSGPTSH